MGDAEALTVWELLRRFASTQSVSFASQEAISWFRRHAPDKANERTLRTHIRNASWNVGDRFEFATKDPFLTRIGHGQFRRAAPEELETWRAERGSTSTAVRVPEPSVTLGDQPLVGASSHIHRCPRRGYRRPGPWRRAPRRVGSGSSRHPSSRPRTAGRAAGCRRSRHGR